MILPAFEEIEGLDAKRSTVICQLQTEHAAFC